MQGVEQMGMIYYHSICRNGELNNQINGVSLWNQNKGLYLNDGSGFILKTLQYTSNLDHTTPEGWYQAYISNFLENESLNIGG